MQTVWDDFNKQNIKVKLFSDDITPEKHNLYSLNVYVLPNCACKHNICLFILYVYLEITHWGCKRVCYWSFKDKNNEREYNIKVLRVEENVILSFLGWKRI